MRGRGYSHTFADGAFVAVMVARILFSPSSAGAQSVTVLHSFSASGPRSPSGLIQGLDGNLYGTSYYGGTNDSGTVYRMTPDGVVTVLHVFTNLLDGGFPRGSLIQASDLNFYGTTTVGGPSGNGTVFRMSADGTVTVLHTFGLFADGAMPIGTLIQATDGNFYGTTYFGGTYDLGTVFRMTAAGTVTVLHAFTGAADGASPYAGLIQATDGSFYGTTGAGGTYNQGVIFRITTAGVFTMLHAFAGGADGASPYDGALIQATDGNLYGTTTSGGADNDGTVFRMSADGTVTVLHAFAWAEGQSPSGLIQASDGSFYGIMLHGPGESLAGGVFRMMADGTVTVLHAFTDLDGLFPDGDLIIAADGNLYGTASGGGPNHLGTAFRMTAGGVLTVLHAFKGGAEGTRPQAALIQATDGDLYGTTYSGGFDNLGTVFRMTADGTVTTLHAFTLDPDGARPTSSLIQASDGDFYGTTSYSIFRITRDGTLTVLHTFFGITEGNASLIQATDGDFYGTTAAGGTYNQGVIFRITAAGVFTMLHAFAGGADGASPFAALIQATDGNFYGTTRYGGPNNLGTVFRMSADGTVTVLHAFAGADGMSPYGALIQATDGNFYGTTSAGGTYSRGAIFRITGVGVFTMLHAFAGGADGASPFAALIQAMDGNFYGTTYYGSVFRMREDGTLTVLHAIDAPPLAALIQVTDGSFYGTTLFGGAHTLGTVFRMTLPDLTMSSLTAPAESGAGLTAVIKETTKNLGAGAAPASTTRIYFSNDKVLDGGDTVIGSRSVSALGSGGSSKGSTTVTIPSGATPGVHYLIAQAEDSDAIAETNESNNILIKKITIGPDLSVSTLSAPSSARAGSSITVSDTTSNTGGAPDGLTTITRFYLSVNAKVDAKDVALGQRSVPVLGANSGNSGVTSITIPASTAPGTYYLIGIADASEIVAEANESNNKKTFAITISR